MIENKSSFLFMDESMVSLDKKHLEMIPNIYEVLKKYFTFVVIISHIDDIKGEGINDEMIIKKDGEGNSSIKYKSNKIKII